MALMLSPGKKAKRQRQAGMTLIELMIAMLVFLVGVTGTMVLMMVALGTNGRNRQQSNSTAIAQMVAEKISSASATPVLTIPDCAANNLNINTGAGGPGVLASGDIDYSAAAPAGYSMLYTTCGTNGRQVVYDVRWNVQTIPPYVKQLTVSARMSGAGNDLRYFSPVVTIRTQVAN